MFKKLEARLSMLNKDRKYILKGCKSNFRDQNNNVQDKKNTLEDINGRLDIAEEPSSRLEEIVIEYIQSETHRAKRLKRTEKRISELWSNFKKPNIYM